MLSLMKNWKGPVEINGVEYKNIQDAIFDFKTVSSDVHIVLRSQSQNALNRKINAVESISDKQSYRITVKAYMTKKATPEFDFMAKWNNNNPMPLRTMTGTIEKETRGMVYMKLHGDIWAERITTCMCCGKRLTNPVSQYFGIGPECGGHNYVNPFDSEDELKEAVAAMKTKLVNTTWEGWIIKSAITEQEEV